MVVAIAEKQAVPERVAMLGEIGDKGWTRRSLSVNPIELVAERVPPLEHAVRASAEHEWIALVFDRKTADRHAVHLLDAWRKLVPPGHVIGGARREDLDVRVPGEMFGNVTGVQLGAAVDRRSVPLNDDGKFHGSFLSEAPGAGLVPESPELLDGHSGSGSRGWDSTASACSTVAAVSLCRVSGSSVGACGATERADPSCSVDVVPADPEVEVSPKSDAGACSGLAAWGPITAAADAPPRRPRRRRRRRLR